ncbi:MAG TPA: universal stress protein [Candidatus Limnocylindria bacterium]|nr:universal stress protein [Candidatus Limnocylindria bacterium]
MKTKRVLTGQREFLVPIDFSAASIQALRLAVGLAEKENAHLILLNVVEEVPSFRNLDAAAQQREWHQQHAARLLEIAGRECGERLKVQTLVRDGNPIHEIERAAAEQHADLIVVGQHRRHGLRRFFHGHTANGVTSRAKCPVVVLNEVPEQRPATGQTD